MKIEAINNYSLAVRRLLKRRGLLLSEIETIRERNAQIKHEIIALDRSLTILENFKGDLNAQMPLHKNQVIFGRGGLHKAILDTLRVADGPMMSRQIALAVIAKRKMDANDTKFVSDVTRRVAKSLRQTGVANRTKDDQGYIWWTRAT